MNYKGIVFDLDGTLLHTLEDLADAVNQVMKKHGFPIHGVQDVRFFVGGGIRNLIWQAMPAKKRQEALTDQCYAEMIEAYKNNFLNRTTLYDGIAELLDFLESQKIKMAVFSNKADELTQKLVQKLLPWPFVRVQGMTTEELKKPNPKIAVDIAHEMGFPVEEIVYVGDTGTDMKTAKGAGMYAVGVSWGFRDRGELQNTGAQMLIDHPRELKTLFES